MQTKRFKLLPMAAALVGLSLAAVSAQALEFHGYFRSGIGWGSKDGGQTCFTLPGVPGNGNGRLGNECGTYGEVQFDHNLYDGKDGVKFDYHIMLGYFANAETDFENLAGAGSHIALRQNYGEVKNLPALGGASLWVGKRYYQRHDIHINDFFYWNDSGPGAGIENYKLGGVNASFAILRENGFANGNPNNSATTKNDLRFAGINPGLGSLEIGLQYNRADTKLAGKKDGTAEVVEWAVPAVGGVNKLTLENGSGSANYTGLANPNNVPGTQDGFHGIQDTFQWQASPDFSGMAAIGTYKFKNNYKWDFAVVRPVFHVSDYFKIQFEAARNSVSPDGLQKATLTKFGVAPTIVAGRGFWTRPEIRFYYTYNSWNDAARDQWGGVAGGTGGPFGNSTNGSTYGIQFEAWW